MGDIGRGQTGGLTGLPTSSVEMAAPFTPVALRWSGQRLFDLALTLPMLLVAAPIMAIVAFCVYLEDGGSACFVQHRLTRGGRTFGCIKFRTMSVDAESRLIALLASDPEAMEQWTKQQKLHRDPRITVIGRFLRKYSLDELPQLFNVLIGDMSLVGPRPIVASEVKRYGRWYKDYCSVRAGLTGLWQVRRRPDTSYRRRVAMDVVYVRSRGLTLDLTILARTLPSLMTGKASF